MLPTSFDSNHSGVVYEKDFEAGTIVLHGNGGGDNSNHGSYYAFVVPQT